MLRPLGQLLLMLHRLRRLFLECLECLEDLEIRPCRLRQSGLQQWMLRRLRLECLSHQSDPRRLLFL